jgi:glyoxylase-like metal-dependent hydrolase (beta-lactamase superfamily II)/rhodanese-related sulfurtransferase
MIFRQLFESVTCTYTYLLGSRPGGEALLIDPVIDKVDRYIQLLDELDLTLVKAVDTHVHADHITALGALRDRTRCVTVMGRESKVDVVSMRVGDGDMIHIENISLKTIHTPGHTDDSYCFALPDRVFTGDTLFIRGTGRTDFQHGSSADAYHSLFEKILTLPDETLVYPGHDYKGDTVSTIGEEKAYNPRLKVNSAEEYAEIMDNLGLAHPAQMDVAVPANLSIGLDQGQATAAGLMVSAVDAVDLAGRAGLVFVDLREEAEREKDGVIPGSVHALYGQLGDFVKPGGLLAVMAGQPDSQLVFYCAHGERSALALEVLREAGIANARHLGGGIDAWVNAGGTLERIADGA